MYMNMITPQIEHLESCLLDVSSFTKAIDKRVGDIESTIILLLYKIVVGCTKKHSQRMTSADVSWCTVKFTYN